MGVTTYTGQVNNYTTDPISSNDLVDTAGIGRAFSINSRWLNISTQKEWVCFSATSGSAIWKEVTDSGFQPTSGLNVANGYAGLDSSGKLIVSQIPSGNFFMPNVAMINQSNNFTSNQIFGGNVVIENVVASGFVSSVGSTSTRFTFIATNPQTGGTYLDLQNGSGVTLAKINTSTSRTDIFFPYTSYVSFNPSNTAGYTGAGRTDFYGQYVFFQNPYTYFAGQSAMSAGGNGTITASNVYSSNRLAWLTTLWNGTSANSSQTVIQDLAIANNNMRHRIAFILRNTSNADAENFSILNGSGTTDGLVGINNTTPAYALDCFGDAQANTFIAKSTTTFPTAVNGKIFFHSTSGHFYGYNGSAWKQLD